LFLNVNGYAWTQNLFWGPKVLDMGLYHWAITPRAWDKKIHVNKQWA
jgi:hypothetical protein